MFDPTDRKRNTDPIEAIGEVLRSVISLDDKARFLLACLDSQSREERRRAIYVMRYVRHPAITSRLQQMVWNEDAAIQSEVLMTLAFCHDPIILSPCSHLVSHGSAMQRAAAISALGFLGSQEAQRLLELLLDSQESRRDRVDAAQSLACCGNPLGKNLLETEYPNSDGPSRIINATLLAKIGSSVGLNAVTQILQEETKSEPEKAVIRRCFHLHLAIDPNLSDSEWNAAVRNWINAKEASTK